MKLETPRLILRPATMKDAERLAGQINNLNVSRNLLVVPYPYTLKDAKWFINHCIDKRKKKPIDDYEFAIELSDEKKVIGGAGISNVNKFQGIGELGYWLAEPYWRKGYGTEACSSLLDLAFHKLNLRKIKITVFAENAASNALARKLGGKLEGTLRKHARAKSTGKIHDET